MIAGTGADARADARAQETQAAAVAHQGAGALGIDKVGSLIAALALLALVFEPFVTFRANRIVSGKGLGFTDIFTAGQAWAFLAVLAAGALFALLRSRPTLRFVVGVVLLLTLCVLLGRCPRISSQRITRWRACRPPVVSGSCFSRSRCWSPTLSPSSRSDLCNISSRLHWLRPLLQPF